MNSSFFLFLLHCILSIGLCIVEGKYWCDFQHRNNFFGGVLTGVLATQTCAGSCPEETCFSSNRETCEFGSSVCGECFQGFVEVGGRCEGKTDKYFFYSINHLEDELGWLNSERCDTISAIARRDSDPSSTITRESGCVYFYIIY